MTHMVSKTTFQSKEPLSVTLQHLRERLDKCWTKQVTMYSPTPIPIGNQIYSSTLSASGETSQVLLSQRGVQTYLIARLDLYQSVDGTRVEAATKIPQNKRLERQFGAWIENGATECKAGG